MKIKFLSEKSNAGIVLAFTAIACILLLIVIACFPWWIMQPENLLEKILSVLVGGIAFLFFVLLLSGFFLNETFKEWDEEERLP